MNTKAQLEFDPAALRDRYRGERNKRLRADGNEQYVEMPGDFEHCQEDPYVDKEIVRDSLTDEVDVVCIGGGFEGGPMGGLGGKT